MKRLVSVVAACSLLAGVAILTCKLNETVPNDGTTAIRANGWVQKGPFITGSSITVQELNAALAPTGSCYQTQITDDFGFFELESELNSFYVEAIAEGFYYDEVAGTLSSAPITLRTISDLSASPIVNINILTFLASERIRYLVENEGMTLGTARSQSEEEVLSVFNIADADGQTFDRMDISKVGEGNAILLAVSAILQASNSVAELSELVSKMRLDMKGDGTLDDTTYIDEIVGNSMNLDLEAVRTNIENRYASLGLVVNIPDFEGYVDSDGDGVINKDDPIPLTWITVGPMSTARQQLAACAVGGKIYAIGGVVSGPGTVLNVVEEYDPIADEWKTRSPMPSARYRAPGVVVGGKIYIVGGTGAPTKVDEYDPSADIWVTRSSAMPTSRSQLSAAEVNGKIYAIGGQSTLTIDEYDPATDGWSSRSATSTGRQSFTASVVGGKIYLIGGYSDSLGQPMSLVEEYDPVADTISTKSAMPTARCEHTSAVVDGEIYVIGGFPGGGSTMYATVEKYEPSTDSWTARTSIPTARRSSAGVAVLDEIYVIGGESYPDANLALVEKYFPANESN